MEAIAVESCTFLTLIILQSTKKDSLFSLSNNITFKVFSIIGSLLGLRFHLKRGYAETGLRTVVPYHAVLLLLFRF